MRKLVNIVLINIIIFFCGCSFLQKKEIDVSAEQDWVVPSNPGKAKAQNEYDVIVVGSGIGGLSCASLLAKSGYKVLVLEQNSHVGGFCASYERNGFTFPVGAHDISGVEFGAIKMLLDNLGLKKDDLFSLHTRTYLLGNKNIIFTGTKNDVVLKLSEIFPNEKQAIIKFFNEAEKAILEKYSLRTDPTKPCPTFTQWSKVTYKQKLDEFFKDADLKTFLCSLLGYLGTKSEQTLAVSALFGCLNYFIYGGYYPKKGGQAFADDLKKFIETHGGQVLLNTKVEEVLVKDNSVLGVRVGGQKFLSPIVVANVNAKTLFLKLISQGNIDKSFVDAIDKLKMSESDGVVNLGVDLDLSNLTSIIKVYLPDDKFSFFINSNADSSTAPKSKSSISIGVNSQYKDVVLLTKSEYQKYKENLADKAIAKIEKIIPGIKKHIIVKDVITPKTFEEFTSMPEGAIYSFDQSIGNKRPYFKTPIKGLYLASASTLPGAGVEAVAASGLRCAKDILITQKAPTKS